MDIITVTYNGKLKTGEEQMFRGALLKVIGEKASMLLHNHVGDGLRYSYPLVQYKVIDDKATIVGIAEGGAAIMNLPKKFELMIGKQSRMFKLGNINMEPYYPSISDDPKMYSLTRYIPLNTDNIKEYDSLPALTDRICFLENIINANILAFFKGIKFHCDTQIQTAIAEIEKIYNIYYKGVRFKGYDMKFISNVLLPNGIGIGKSSSIGFGLLERTTIPNYYEFKE